ncbi:MAG: hypothetical protein HYZ34_13020 [Ignavibacteriae bacterium]|nr:hypothetical protein [Ignavibacteriota bacterium]
MILQSSVEEVISEIEKSGNRKFKFRQEVSSLLTISQEQNMSGVFDDILFFSKFLSHAYAVLNREGTTSETTRPLQQEFKTTLEKLHTLLRTLIKEADGLLKQDFVSRFLNMKPECMENLLALANELTWVKNYQLDTPNKATQKK